MCETCFAHFPDVKASIRETALGLFIFLRWFPLTRLIFVKVALDVF